MSITLMAETRIESSIIFSRLEFERINKMHVWFKIAFANHWDFQM